MAISGVAKGYGCSDDLLLLALGEDYSARILAHHFHCSVECISRWIETPGEAAGVAAQVFERPVGDTRVHGSFRNRGRDPRDESGIECFGNYVFRAECEATSGGRR